MTAGSETANSIASTRNSRRARRKKRQMRSRGAMRDVTSASRQVRAGRFLSGAQILFSRLHPGAESPYSARAPLTRLIVH